jgi:magnesium transporter
MLAYYAKRSLGEEFEKLKNPLSEDVWIDGSNLAAEDIDHLIKTYDLAQNIVYDVRDHHELPRVEVDNGTAYVFIRIPRLAKSGHVVSSPMLCVVKKHLFLSLTQFDSISPETVADTTLPVTTRETQELLLGVIAACIAKYQDSIRHTERSINDTASRLRSHEVTNQDFIHFVVVEDNLTAYRINLEGLAAVLKRLRDSQHESLAAINTEALEDMLLQVQQLLVAVESYGGRVKSIRGAYSTIANNNLNKRMKILTVITVLITLPNVIFGMYGMNVVLPFSQQPWAYGAILGLSIVVILVVFAVARRLRIF